MKCLGNYQVLSRMFFKLYCTVAYRAKCPYHWHISWLVTAGLPIHQILYILSGCSRSNGKLMTLFKFSLHRCRCNPQTGHTTDITQPFIHSRWPETFSRVSSSEACVIYLFVCNNVFPENFHPDSSMNKVVWFSIKRLNLWPPTPPPQIFCTYSVLLVVGVDNSGTTYYTQWDIGI